MLFRNEPGQPAWGGSEMNSQGGGTALAAAGQGFSMDVLDRPRAAQCRGQDRVGE